METIKEKLFDLRDEKYAQFTRMLIPTVDPALVIGVRAPAVGKLTRELVRSGNAPAFLGALPHTYLEENLLHAALLGKLPLDFDELLRRVEEFLPYVDNWAVCDKLPPKVFAAHRDAVYGHVRIWLTSEKPYTVRFALVTLLSFFLESDVFDPAMLNVVAALPTDDYYVNMAAAWYVSYALIKQYDQTLPAIEGRLFSQWVHNKSIQKAIESYRVDSSRKAYLKTLRRK